MLVALLGMVILTALAGAAQAQDPQPTVRVLYVKGIIDPVTTRYVQRALEQTQASLYVIVLDTPGGSLQSMRDMVQVILGSSVPVAVYVAPPGARAGSAGTFITLAAHVAAMAPSTNIGAAHPVDAGGGDIPGVLGDKVTQDAAALARSLAERYG
ncbi:MAG: nodulation protein NfeD, partial [Anaerolineae bacterium]